MDLEIGVIEIPEAIGIEGTDGFTLRLKVLIIFGPEAAELGLGETPGLLIGMGDTPGLFIFIGGGTNTVLTWTGFDGGWICGDWPLPDCGMNVAICLGVGGLVAEVRGAPNLGFWEGTGGFGLNCLNIYVLINQQLLCVLLSKKPLKKKRMSW